MGGNTDIKYLVLSTDGFVVFLWCYTLYDFLRNREKYEKKGVVTREIFWRVISTLMFLIVPRILVGLYQLAT